MKYILMIAVVMLMSGCTGAYKDRVEQKIKDAKLHEKVTTVCYDLIEKKECPSGALQFDVNILPFIPMNSRVCLGFTDANVSVDGMYCYSRDIIK